jgi:predicted ABC-type exoprotein transport system permease subunit
MTLSKEQERRREEAEFQRDRRKWRIRRRFAISSFVQLVLLTLFYIIAPFCMTADQAQTFAEFNSIIITLIGFHTGLVMLYMGAVTYNESISKDMYNKNIESPEDGIRR